MPRKQPKIAASSCNYIEKRVQFPVGIAATSKALYKNMAAETHSRIHIHTSQVFVTVSAAKGEAFNKICKLTCDCFNERRKALKKFTPNIFNTKHLLHQTSYTIYKRHLLQDTFYTSQRLHNTSFTRDVLLHQPTPATFYTSHL